MPVSALGSEVEFGSLTMDYVRGVWKGKVNVDELQESSDEKC